MDPNAKRGLAFFAVYLLLYLAFVLTNAFSPATMERAPVAGINLAILSGFGLIFAAFVMALLYGWMCRNESPAKLEKIESSSPGKRPASTRGDGQ